MKISTLFTSFILLCCAQCLAQPGALDLTFHGDGAFEYSYYPGYEQAHEVALQPDGKILLSGYSSGIDYGILILRLNTDGTPDSTFGNNGFVDILTNNYSGGTGNSLAIQPDGKILVNSMSNNGDYRDFSVVRLNSDGSPDLEFGNNGEALLDIGSNCNANEIALQPDGKIIVSADAGSFTNTIYIFRLNSNGTPDSSFGSNGMITLAELYLEMYGKSLILQPDGKILVSGITAVPFDPIRY